jgi:hypothetical protein
VRSCTQSLKAAKISLRPPAASRARRATQSIGIASAEVPAGLVLKNTLAFLASSMASAFLSQRKSGVWSLPFKKISLVSVQVISVFVNSDLVWGKRAHKNLRIR